MLGNCNKRSRTFSTDGTFSGNQLVHDIGNQFSSMTFIGANAFQIQSSAAAEGKIAKFNGKLYFEANDQAQENNFKLWSSDGTSAGAQNIAPNVVYGPIRYFKEFNGRLYFTAKNKFQSTDGTTAGTTLLSGINPAIKNNIPSIAPKANPVKISVGY